MEDDAPENPGPDAGSSSGGSSGSSSGATGTSGNASSSSGGPSVCSFACEVGAKICDNFDRAIPDDNGWTFVSPGTKTPDDFHIENDAGGPCLGRFFVSTSAPGIGGAVARMMQQTFTTLPKTTLTLEFDFRWKGNLALTNGGRAAFVALTTVTDFNLSENQPFIAFMAANEQFKVLGRGPNGSNPAEVTLAIPIDTDVHLSMKLFLQGGPATVAVDGATSIVPLPGIVGGAPSFHVLVGEALLNTAGAGSLEARYDNFKVTF